MSDRGVNRERRLLKTQMTDQQRDLGEAKIEMLHRAGYVWQGPPPGVFSHPEIRDAIDYFAVLPSRRS